MLRFRCTARVLKRFQIEPDEAAPPSTGLLGDWYVNLLNVGRIRLVLCTSERTLLPVLLPARNEDFPGGFPAALGAVLSQLGVPRALLEAEVQAAAPMAFAKTQSRVVLGVMNDFAFQAQVWMDARPSFDLVQVALRLAEIPSKPIGYQSAAQIAQALLAAGSPS
jgi:hypothetical protein